MRADPTGSASTCADVLGGSKDKLWPHCGAQEALGSDSQGIVCRATEEDGAAEKNLEPRESSHPNGGQEGAGASRTHEAGRPMPTVESGQVGTVQHSLRQEKAGGRSRIAGPCLPLRIQGGMMWLEGSFRLDGLHGGAFSTVACGDERGSLVLIIAYLIGLNRVFFLLSREDGP